MDQHLAPCCPRTEVPVPSIWHRIWHRCHLQKPVPNQQLEDSPLCASDTSLHSWKPIPCQPHRIVNRSQDWLRFPLSWRPVRLGPGTMQLRGVRRCPATAFCRSNAALAAPP